MADPKDKPVLNPPQDQGPNPAPNPGSGMTPVPFRAGGFQPQGKRWAPWLAFLCLIGLWQLSSSFGWLSPVIMPSPAQVGLALWQQFADGQMPKHIATSGYRLLWGWSLGTLAGLTVGMAMGIWSLSRAVGLPVVAALFPVPKIALLPLFILWFGIGEPSKIAVILFGVFFPTVIATFSAVDNVPRSLIRMAQSFSIPYHHIVLKVILPAALPGILAGFRITSAIGLILLVAAEMIGAEYGIGAFIIQSGNLMQTDKLVAGVVILSVLGLSISTILTRLERRLLKWR